MDDRNIYPTMENEAETAARVLLKRAGYSPLPLNGKPPAMDQWSQKYDANLQEINLWGVVYPWCHNTGILTRLTPTVDIDILNDDAAAAVEDLVREMFEERGPILVRFGKAPKRAILLRTDKPFKKLATSLIAPDGSREQKIELLCDGQQVVVFGVHPETHRLYTWHGGEPGKIRWEDLPYVSTQEAEALIKKAGDLLVSEYGFKPIETTRTNGATVVIGDFRHANWAQLVSNVVMGTELHDSLRDLSASFVASGIAGDSATRVLQSLMLPSSAPHDDRWRQRFEEISRAIISAEAKFKPTGKAAPGVLPICRPFPLNEAEIPPRDWIVPGLLLRKMLTVLVAPSGSGKSLLTLQLALALASNIEWAGWRPRAAYNVLVVNAEDDVDEMKRRLAGMLRYMPIDQRAIAERFIIADNPEGVVLARFDARTKTLVRTPLVETLLQIIALNRIDVIFVDPFAETFEGDENSNSELKWAGMLWREIARRTNAAICLVHHTKKYATGMAGDVDAARGASALIGIARVVSTLFPMTATEAEALSVEGDLRGNYLRYDDAKANFNLKSAVAKWFHKETVVLDNKTAERPGDQVGVLIPWTAAPASVTQDRINEFFHFVDRGLVRGESRELYSWESAAGDRSILRQLERFFDVPTTTAKRHLKDWRKNELLAPIRYYSMAQRKKIGGIRSHLYDATTDPNPVPLEAPRAAKRNQPQLKLVEDDTTD
jgi:hypothetical protein